MGGVAGEMLVAASSPELSAPSLLEE